MIIEIDFTFKYHFTFFVTIRSLNLIYILFLDYIFLWFLSFDKVWFTSLFGFLLRRIFTRENSNFLLDLIFIKPLAPNFLFCFTITNFCWIEFSDKLAFFSTISFYKKINLIVVNTQLKFIIRNRRPLKKTRFLTTNILFLFLIISFSFFWKRFFVIASQIIEFWLRIKKINN